MPPPRSYVVCATPRCGSTLLCEALAASGVAGRPEEYFQALASTGKARTPREYLGWLEPDLVEILGERSPVDDERTQIEAAGCTGFGEYLELVRTRATTPNGVLGFKLMWGYLDGLVEALREHLEAAELDARGALERAFGELGYVHVTRRDRVRQAVSLWRALQTWTWRAEAERPGRAEPQFHAEAVDRLVRLLRAEDGAWRTWFAAEGIEPITVVYEELVADLPGCLADTLRALGLAVPPHVEDLAPPLHRQADELSDDWVERYRAAYAADDDDLLASVAE